jgi:ubiquinone/menaquinone biosynthesis C-methylase UbiE
MSYLYQQFSKNNNEFQQKIWGLVVDKLNWNGNGQALDIGTGSGGLAIQLAKKHPSAKIQAIDYWGKGWDYSRVQCEANAKIEGVGKNLNFKRASAKNLPFSDGELDAVVSNFVFHEVRSVRDKSKLFLEAFRVLKKGGRFSIQDVLFSTRKYDDINDLVQTIKSWGIQEITLIKTEDEISMPSKLMKKFMETAGILCGIK